MSSIALTESPPPARRIHVIGAGPVGLLLTALLQPIAGLSLRLYEKRPDYLRTRMVRIAPYLADESIEGYRTDHIDADSVEAIFDPEELEANLAFKHAIPTDLMSHLRQWTQGFCPLNTIEHALSSLIDARGSRSVERVSAAITAESAIEMLEPGDIVVDCTGSKSVLRDHLAPDGGPAEANTVNLTLEYAVVVTFLYGKAYDCNECCKYYKNAENPHYKFIPSVDRTFNDRSISHVTGIIHITAEDYDAMPQKFDGPWLRQHFPVLALSMEHFIDKIKEETHGEIVGDLDIIRIPLNLYHARNYTSRKLLTGAPTDHPFTRSPVFLAGDSAIGSPYFQSITLGFESAMYLAGLLADRGLLVEDMLERYERFGYKQWLRVYMRSKMIKHNKDLFELVDDPIALLEKLHIY